MTFVSASITAFFSTKITYSPESSGSYGVGFTIDRGVKARLTEKHGVYYNGEKVEFPTVEHVLKKLGADGVELESNVPISAGFGVSGASALATAIEISVCRGLNYSLGDLADMAHEAEVLNLTGLGDVVTQYNGGVVARIEAGKPTKAIVLKFPFRAEFKFLAMGKLLTKEVLRDELKRDAINKTGKLMLKEFLKKPSVENLVSLSKEFALKTGLADDDVRDAIEAVESAGGKAGMAMLGKTVFALNAGDALDEFRGEKFKARVTLCGISV